MKKTKIFLSVVVFTTFQTLSYGQEIRSKINQMLADYVVPVLILGCICGAIVGLLSNWDLIQDKNDNGTRNKGLLNAGLFVLYAFIIVGVIGSIVVAVKAINIQI